MLEHRAAAHVKTTYVPIEPRVVRIARVKLTGALYSVFRMAEGRPPGKAFNPWSGYPIGWFEPASNFSGVIVPGSRRMAGFPQRYHRVAGRAAFLANCPSPYQKPFDGHALPGIVNKPSGE
jgi:hypothetical protein